MIQSSGPKPTSSKLPALALTARAEKPYHLTANRPARQPALAHFLRSTNQDWRHFNASICGGAPARKARACCLFQSAQNPRQETPTERSSGLAINAKPFGKLCPRIQVPWPGPICYPCLFYQMPQVWQEVQFLPPPPARTRSSRDRGLLTTPLTTAASARTAPAAPSPKCC